MIKDNVSSPFSLVLGLPSLHQEAQLSQPSLKKENSENITLFGQNLFHSESFSPFYSTDGILQARTFVMTNAQTRLAVSWFPQTKTSSPHDPR